MSLYACNDTPPLGIYALAYSRILGECPGYDPYNSVTTHLCISRDVWNSERVKQVRTWDPWRYGK